MPTSLAARLAWLVPGSLFAVATLGWGTMNLIDLTAHERHHEHQEFTTPITALDIDTGKGGITIIGTDGNTAVVDTTVSEGLRAGDHSERVQGDRLVIRSSCPAIFSTWCGVDYTVRVPAATVVTAHSDGAGIDVSGVTGDVTVSSSGGGVHVAGGGGGTMTLDSSGGGVSGVNLTADVVTARSSGGGVHLSFAEPPRSVKAGSSGGGVTVEVPDTPGAYQVHASSSGGGVHTGIRTDPSSPNVIDASSSGGGVTIRYPAG